MKRRYAEYHRFLALRACWSILRGDGVVWKIALTGRNELETLGNGLLVAGCTVNGKPLRAEHVFHGDPEGQDK